MRKIESSKHKVSDFDNTVEIEIDDLEEKLCRKYYQVIRFYIVQILRLDGIKSNQVKHYT